MQDASAWTAGRCRKCSFVLAASGGANFFVPLPQPPEVPVVPSGSSLIFRTPSLFWTAVQTLSCARAAYRRSCHGVVTVVVLLAANALTTLISALGRGDWLEPQHQGCYRHEQRHADMKGPRARSSEAIMRLGCSQPPENGTTRFHFFTCGRSCSSFQVSPNDFVRQAVANAARDCEHSRAWTRRANESD